MSLCHLGDVEVFRYKNIVFHGGDMAIGASIWLPDVLVDLTNGAFIPLRSGQTLIRAYCTGPGIIKVPDSFWRDLLKKLFELSEHKEVLHVMFCGIGGHKCVATALSIMAGLLGAIDPVGYIRERYCRYAVESDAQEQYILRYGLTLP